MEYQIIYADPPWQYDFSKSSNRTIENHYPTMTVEQLCQLPIPAAFDSILYLWATAPKLEQALWVMAAWEYKYKTHAVWDKCLIGMGYWFRGQHELLLVGTRGKVQPPESAFRFPSVYREKRTKHSKKPDYFRDLITKTFPNKSKIELFARTKTPGWDVWGNEVEGDIELKF